MEDLKFGRDPTEYEELLNKHLELEQLVDEIEHRLKQSDLEEWEYKYLRESLRDMIELRDNKSREINQYGSNSTYIKNVDTLIIK